MLNTCRLSSVTAQGDPLETGCSRVSSCYWNFVDMQLHLYIIKGLVALYSIWVTIATKIRLVMVLRGNPLVVQVAII